MGLVVGAHCRVALFFTVTRTACSRYSLRRTQAGIYDSLIEEDDMKKFSLRFERYLGASCYAAARLGLLVLALGPVAFCQIISFDPPGSTLTQVTSLNLSGTIVGYYTDSQNVEHSFMRDSTGSVTTLDAPGAAFGTYAYSINDGGDIAGNYNGSDRLSHGFVRSAAGVFTEFDVVAGPAHTPSALTIVVRLPGYIPLLPTARSHFCAMRQGISRPSTRRILRGSSRSR